MCVCEREREDWIGLDGLLYMRKRERQRDWTELDCIGLDGLLYMRETETERERLILFNYGCLSKYLLFNAVKIICCVFHVFFSLYICVKILVYCLFYFLPCTLRQISL